MNQWICQYLSETCLSIHQLVKQWTTVLCKSIKSELWRISLIALPNFRRNIGDNSMKDGKISQGHSKIRKAKQNIKEANFLTPENLKRFCWNKTKYRQTFVPKKQDRVASKIRFRDFIYYIQKRLFTNRNLWLNKNVVNLLQGKNCLLSTLKRKQISAKKQGHVASALANGMVFGLECFDRFHLF